jgi:methyltransferase (TIGR04290 family)
MAAPRLQIVMLGLSITSSWGNGHATTYRGLMRELVGRGHGVLFLERDMPWYAEHRDLPNPPFGQTKLYGSLEELKSLYAATIRDADLVMLGSFVPDGIQIGEWITHIARGVAAFYDIDTPVTLAKLRQGSCEYLSASLLPAYDLYLSFTGGPLLAQIAEGFGAQMVRPLYCSADTALYYPDAASPGTDLGYMGTFSPDRQPGLQQLLVEPARRWPQGRFLIAGPQYPDVQSWPANITYRDHLSPGEHREFYACQRFTLNLTRADMIRAGYSPSVRLFEAAACGTPVISDYWPGLESFFTPDEEILVSSSAEQTLRYLTELPEQQRVALGQAARRRLLAGHTAAHRAAELEGHTLAVFSTRNRHNGRGLTLETQIDNAATPAERKVLALGPWFHNLHLPDGTQTAPGHKLGDFPATLWAAIAPALPQDLAGWRVLDIGCNAGFYCFELAKRGAHCTGIDIDEHYLRQARWAAAELGLSDSTEFHRSHVYNLHAIPHTYDLVLFMGLFYHLRHPLLALDIVAQKVRRLMVFQTLTMPGESACRPQSDLGFDQREAMLDAGWPKMGFIEKNLAGDPTNWWAPNHAAVEALLRSSGFFVRRIATEIYLCQPTFELAPGGEGERLPAYTNLNPASFVDAQRELRFATGREKSFDEQGW